LLAARLTLMLPGIVASRSSVAVYFSDARPPCRLLGLCRLMIELSYAVDPFRACSLFARLNPLLDEAVLPGFGVGEPLASQIRKNIFAAAAHAAMQVGSFHAALELADTGRRVRSHSNSDQVDGWLDKVRLEILIRTMRLSEALRVRRAIDDAAAAKIGGMGDLDIMLEDFLPAEPGMDLWAPSRRMSRWEETRQLISTWLPSQQDAHAALQQSIAAAPMSAPERRRADALFAGGKEALAAIGRAISADDASDEARQDIIARESFRYQSIIRKIQTPSTRRRRTLHDNRHILNRGSLTVRLKAPTQPELKNAAADAMSASRYSARVGDLHGELNALWAQALIADRRHRTGEAFEYYRRVLGLLIQHRSGLPTIGARAIVAGTFRTLVPRIASLALEREEDSQLTFRALEFRRGIAILEPNLHAASAALTFPPGIHYFAVSVIPDHSAFACLRTDDGNVSVCELVLPPDAAVKAAFADPETWRSPFAAADRSPRAAFPGLMTLLEAAYRDGRIRPGDHIAAALDHPLHLLPIHYFDLEGDFAARHLTFSRVASFEDLARIAGSAPRPIGTAAAAFVLTDDAIREGSHREAFARSVRPIKARFGSLPLTAGIAGDKAAVLELLASSELAHLYAHGVFPDAHPGDTVDVADGAGLILAHAGRIPSRLCPGAGLLSVREILDHGPLSARHVSLCACVSGLGRPGRAQDMLGLEFALRARGVDSVLASHWSVNAGFAADFYEAFYTAWLAEGVGRGKAWQAALLAGISSGRTLRDKCAACAFSLYGDWR
jgi:hypothetical protein